MSVCGCIRRRLHPYPFCCSYCTCVEIVFFVLMGLSSVLPFGYNFQAARSTPINFLPPTIAMPLYSFSELEMFFHSSGKSSRDQVFCSCRYMFRLSTRYDWYPQFLPSPALGLIPRNICLGKLSVHRKKIGAFTGSWKLISTNSWETLDMTHLPKAKIQLPSLNITAPR